MDRFKETICAPASSVGGAISLIRVSGPDALAVIDRTVSFNSCTAQSSKGYTVKFGYVSDSQNGELVDEVLVSIFKAPHSYTGEDSAEIGCHGSRYIVGRILELLIRAGARMAEPGEFTRRAFLAGKMDLAQAEAVADLIAADSQASHRVALNQLRGGYSTELSALRDKMLELTSLLELELDFSEEDVEFASRTELSSLLDRTIAQVKRLSDSFHLGNAIRNGVPVAIVGAPNSGKSTILNDLLGDDRAIVSDIPGTTRDTVEETFNLGGILYRFIDTAGIRESSDDVEKIGIRRSFEKLKTADIVILVLDAMTPLNELKEGIKRILKEMPEGTLITVRNKVDVYDAISAEDCPARDSSYGLFELKNPAFGTFNLSPEELASQLTVPSVLDISALTGEGMDKLRNAIMSASAAMGIAWNVTTMGDNVDAVSKMSSGNTSFKEYRDCASAASGKCNQRLNTQCLESEVSIVTNLRHYEALCSAQDALLRVRNALNSNTAADLLSQDLREALYYIGTITGSITTDEVLGEIFGRFCIGK